VLTSFLSNGYSDVEKRVSFHDFKISFKFSTVRIRTNSSFFYLSLFSRLSEFEQTALNRGVGYTLLKADWPAGVSAQAGRVADLAVSLGHSNKRSLI